MLRCNFLQSLKNSLRRGFRATVNFRRFKTGSSTVGTIVLSYGVNRNHRIVLDPDLSDMGWPAPLELNQFSSLMKSDEAKIFVSHIRFNKGPVNSVFPKPEAKYITIVRHPVSQFKSAWLYYSISKLAHIPENIINTFLKDSFIFQTQIYLIWGWNKKISKT